MMDGSSLLAGSLGPSREAHFGALFVTVAYACADARLPGRGLHTLVAAACARLLVCFQLLPTFACLRPFKRQMSVKR